MRQFPIILSLFIFLLGQSLWAQSVEIYKKRGRSKSTLNWSTEIETKWVENRDKVPVYTYILKIDVPGGAKKARSKRKNKVKVEDGQLIVNMTSLVDKVLVLTGRGKQAFYIKITDSKPGLDSQLCDEKKLLLQKVIESQKFPFRVDMKCYERDSEEYLVVSVPKEVRWASTTIPENQGKGENWKEYRIEDLPSGDGEIRGVFTFRYKKKNYKIELRSKPDPDVLISQKGKSTKFYAGLGLINLTVKTDISEVTDSPYVFIAGVETELPFWEIIAGLNVVAAFSTESSEGATEKPPEFIEGRVHFGRFFKFSESFGFAPLVLGIFQNSSDPNVLLKIKHNQLGFGGALAWQITDSFDFRYDVWTSGFLAATATSQLGMQANITYDISSSFGIGLNVGNQSLSVEGTTGSKNEMTETHYGAFIRF